MDDLRIIMACEAEQSTDVVRIVELVIKTIEGDVRRIAEAMVLKPDDQLLGPGEFDLRNKVLGMARHIVEATVNDRKKEGHQGSSTICPHCGENARFVEWRNKMFVSLFGEVTIQFA
jgi:hypothetical protein